MDGDEGRRPFLDKLLHFMEERGTPIAQCPTISKNPLDLYRLYLFTKEKGGFMEVSTFIPFHSVSHRGFVVLWWLMVRQMGALNDINGLFVADEGSSA